MESVHEHHIGATSTMHRFSILLFICMLGTASAAPLRASAPPDQHHVMWTTEKGARKCITKKTREKAEKAAALLRKISFFKDIQVLPGKCDK